MPDLIDSKGNLHTTPEAKMDLIAESIWGKNNQPEVVPLPELRADRVVLPMDRTLEEKEVKNIINGLHRRKQPGLDFITAEALKLGRDVLVPFLTIIFRA